MEEGLLNVEHKDLCSLLFSGTKLKHPQYLVIPRISVTAPKWQQNAITCRLHSLQNYSVHDLNELNF